ncbi:MAG: DUF1868 domain-containing protein [Pseudomonadota bacterium]
MLAKNPPKPERPDPIDVLTGRHLVQPYPPGISLPGEGGKFATDGRVQTWKGNTFVCHVEPSSDAYSALVGLQEAMKRGPFGAFYTWLPAPSFHMTVFQGMSPGKQGTDDWVKGIPPNARRDAVSTEVVRRIQGVELPRFQITAHGLFGGNSVTVSGKDGEQEGALREARKTLREKTGIQPPGFDTYVFHITLGYLIQWLTEETAQATVSFADSAYADFAPRLRDIPIGPCQFCNFDSMHHFEPLVDL